MMCSCPCFPLYQVTRPSPLYLLVPFGPYFYLANLKEIFLPCLHCAWISFDNLPRGFNPRFPKRPFILCLFSNVALASLKMAVNLNSLMWCNKKWWTPPFWQIDFPFQRTIYASYHFQRRMWSETKWNTRKSTVFLFSFFIPCKWCGSFCCSFQKPGLSKSLTASDKVLFWSFRSYQSKQDKPT